jgi:hypothetical protein
MMNDANVKYGDFIQFADYHTLVQNNLVGMIEPPVPGTKANGYVSEPNNDNGRFVKRISFLSYKTMKDVFLKKMNPLAISVLVNNVNLHGLTLHAYWDGPNEEVYLITSNMSANDIDLNSLKLGGSLVPLNAGVDTYFIKGPALHSSRGATAFVINDQNDQIQEVSLNNQNFQNISIPAYSVGYIVVPMIHEDITIPTIPTEEPEIIDDNNSGPLMKIRNSASWSAQNGHQYAELDSDFDGPSGSIMNEKASTMISQTINTIPGQSYNLRFYLAAHPGSSASDSKTAVYLNGNVLDSSFISGFGEADSKTAHWVQRQYRFTASDDETTIGIGDIGTANTIGSFVDNVSVVCVVPKAKAGTSVSGCDSSVNLIKNGSFESPAVTNSANWDIFSQADLEGWDVSWQPGSGN